MDSSIEWDFVPTGSPRAGHMARLPITELDALLGDWYANPEPKKSTDVSKIGKIEV
jgi:hypothetical protein